MLSTEEMEYTFIHRTDKGLTPALKLFASF